MSNKVHEDLDLRDRWFGVKMVKKPFSPQVYTKHDKNGIPVTFKQQAEATAEYLDTKHWAAPTNEAARTITLPRTYLVPTNTTFDTSPITETELSNILKNLKNNKAGGPDTLVMEHLKHLDDYELGPLAIILNNWWDTGKGPDDITLARVASIFKKGDPNEQGNYRPISLLNILYKILAAI